MRRGSYGLCLPFITGRADCGGEGATGCSGKELPRLRGGKSTRPSRGEALRSLRKGTPLWSSAPSPSPRGVLAAEQYGDRGWRSAA